MKTHEDTHTQDPHHHDHDDQRGGHAPAGPQDPARDHDRAAHDEHGGHGKHAGHHVDMFRRRFWISLALSVPVVVFAVSA